jgi:hypothetical protein
MSIDAIELELRLLTTKYRPVGSIVASKAISPPVEYGEPGAAVSTPVTGLTWNAATDDNAGLELEFTA